VHPSENITGKTTVLAQAVILLLCYMQIPIVKKTWYKQLKNIFIHYGLNTCGQKTYSKTLQVNGGCKKRRNNVTSKSLLQ